MKSKNLLRMLLLLMFFQVAGCGTLMFEERRGQKEGKLDPNVVVMDGFGLLFFIIPGLIAFIVDYSTGAIYLPPGVEKGEGPFFGERATDASDD